MSLSYRNQSIYFLSKSVDWFLYDRYVRYERIDGVVRKKKLVVELVKISYLSSISRVIFKVNQETRTLCESYLK